MSNVLLVPEGCQVVSIDKNKKYKLHDADLAKILLHPDIIDLDVVVVSVAGGFRSGKSFLLSFFLRYLYYMYMPNPRLEFGFRDWLGNADDILRGFSWRGGSKRDTSGIVLWSQPIVTTLKNGRKVAILLMDTQGTFDHSSTIRDCSTIFGLSTLLSSVQIYNLQSKIREDDLQHLQLFAEYGRMASLSGTKPFQQLMFLVRDWNFPYDFAHGARGGMKYYEDVFKVDPEENPELKDVRDHVVSCFEELKCFLMPYPGDTVASDPNFKGRLSGISDKFKTSLKELVPSIFAQDNLLIKRINSTNVTAGGLFHYFQVYMQEFNSDEFPKPYTIMQASSKVGVMMAKTHAQRAYEETMNRLAGLNQDRSVSRRKLSEIHDTAIADAMVKFRAVLARTMGVRKDDDNSLFNEVLEVLDNLFNGFNLINTAKTERAITAAKQTYKDSMQHLPDGEDLCFHPKDLESVQAVAVETAVRVFDSHRITPGDIEDEDRTEMIQALTNEFQHYQVINERSNRDAVLEARRAYYNSLTGNEDGTYPCSDPDKATQRHQEALDKAMDAFRQKRKRQTQHKDDKFREQLEKDVEEQWRLYATTNKSNKFGKSVKVGTTVVSVGAAAGTMVVAAPVTIIGGTCVLGVIAVGAAFKFFSKKRVRNTAE